MALESLRAQVIASRVARTRMCHGQGCRVFFGDKLIPPLIGNPYNGYINPYWVDEFIPYYMEIMGVDRPDRTYKKRTFPLAVGVPRGSIYLCTPPILPPFLLRSVCLMVF